MRPSPLRRCLATWATKHQIKEAVELLLQSKVKAIRTVRIPSRTKRLGRFVGTSNPRKKAYVELAEGAPASE